VGSAAFHLEVAMRVATGGCSSPANDAGSGAIGGGAAAGGFGATGGVGGVGATGGIGGGVPDGGFCTGLQCQQQMCTVGTTSISGIVYDPAGKNPLYNVAVYVPNQQVRALPSGASCDSCESNYSGQPIAVGLTDAAGRFSIPNAPVGTNIPLVVQIGKWRRQFLVPNVVACQDNPTVDKSLTLPKNHLEGDIPNIAIATGGADTLECLLRRIGVDASEFVPGASTTGRIHIFQGGDVAAPNTDPVGPLASSALWNTSAELMKYDIVLLSCEGAETVNMNQQAMHDYTSAGGRLFASHFHYSWFTTGPFSTENLATWTPGANALNNVRGEVVTRLSNGDPFPKGVAMMQWLANVGALFNNRLDIFDPRHNADVGPQHTVSQAWIVADANSDSPGATQYFSFNTPTDVINSPDRNYCGRVVYSDLHVGAAAGDDTDFPVPESCAPLNLSAQEKALEFMLFDLSSCVIPDNLPPEPPLLE